MADSKISQLGTANVVNKNDLFYVVQDNTSKSVTGATLFASIMDPTLGGNILVGGNVQTLTTAGTISVATTRTDLFGGLSANTNAIANGTVLPATIYLYTANVSASGRGLTFANGSPFTRTIYVKHINGKINLSTAGGALTYPPTNWADQVGTPPFPTGLNFVKGATYIFDVSDPTNASNIIGLSTSIDGTNTLGSPYTPNVTINGTPGTPGANITFTPANVSIDQGGKNYLDIPQGVDGQLKIINLVSTSGGTFVISSNVQNNLAIELKRAGDSAFLMYSGNAWILVGSNPGLTTTFSGSSDDVLEGSKLFFTNARARAAITAGDSSIIYDPILGTVKANVAQLSNINVANIVPSTDILTEGNVKLFYTNARVISAVTPYLTTSNVLEGSNLYFTNARVYANVIGLLNTKANVVDLTTSNVAEGSNLYFTNARAIAAIANQDFTFGNVYANNFIAYDTVYANGLVIQGLDVTTSISAGNIVSNSTSTLELVSSNIITNSIRSNVWDNLYTANVIESPSNLYYTNARVDAFVTPKLTTANVVEIDSNLYYTNARVDAFVTPKLTTANVVEIDSNLYYTNARVYANVTQRLQYLDTNIVPVVDSVYNLGSDTRRFKDLWLSGATIRLGNTLLSESAGGGLSVTSPAGNVAIVSDTVSSNIWVGLYTANVIESDSNLYYTNARVRSTLSNGTGVYYDKVTGAISIGQNVDTTSTVTFGGLNVYGFTNFYGNVTTHASNNLSISDNMIYLNSGSETSNPDLGIAGNYNDGTYRHAGFFRDASDNGTWKVYENYAPEPDANIFINTDHTSFRLANLAATTFTGNVVGNVTGFVSSIGNFSTSDLVEGTRLYYTNARVLSNVSQMSINVFADVDITGITANGTLIWNGTSFVAGVTSAAQSANISQSANVSNTVLSLDNFTTSNLIEGTNLYFTNTRAVSALTTANVTTANLTVTGIINARSNVGLTLGTASQGNLISNAITMTVDTTVTNGIAQLNEILGKLVPASPPAFPGNGYIAINTLSSYRMANFVQTDNTTSARNVGPANVVSVVRRAAAYTTTTLNDMGPGNSGTLTLYKNSSASGSKALTTSSDNGTYGDLVISDNVDYSTKTGQAGGFWESFDSSASGTVSAGWNEIYINHSAGGSSNIAFWYYDSSNPGAVVFSVPSIYPVSNTYANSSTVPHFTSATVFTMTANVKNLSGDMYPTSNTFVTGSSSTGFGTPASLNYESTGVTGITLPLTRNLYVASGNAQISTNVNISSGFGSTTTAPSLTGINSYSNGTGTFTLGATILYKTPTVSSLTTMEESNIFVQANVGSGSGYGARIINPGSSDTPTQSASATLFNSNTSTLLSYDATIVAASLKHDQTNYSTGYLPVGPNLSSGRSGAQYFTFKFIRTSVSKFNIQFTGAVAGMWVALPGSTIDTSSTLNGWLDMSTAYAGSGVPGAGTGGNGSNGCALGGPVTLNSNGTQSKTCTFGTTSSSSTGTNEIYVRLKLTAGQSITALAILGASN